MDVYSDSTGHGKVIAGLRSSPLVADVNVTLNGSFD
jgi:hypothetical protein